MCCCDARVVGNFAIYIAEFSALFFGVLLRFLDILPVLRTIVEESSSITLHFLHPLFEVGFECADVLQRTAQDDVLLSILSGQNIGELKSQLLVAAESGDVSTVDRILSVCWPKASPVSGGGSVRAKRLFKPDDARGLVSEMMR